MPSVKKRKATNTVRREEAEALKKEIAVLQGRAQQLQAHAELTALTPKEHLQLLARSLRTKYALEELVQDQKMVFAGAQSELTNFQEKQVWNPLYTYIHLPQCWNKRKQIIVGLQDEKLTNAVQYVQARSQHLNLLRRHSSEDRYEDADGVFCCNRFEVNQLVGVRSMKEVYEAAKFFFTNVEISTTEALGHITVREDYDSIGDDGSISSFRLISARPSGIVTESNKVLYNRYFDHHELLGERPCAVMVTDNVDIDELHPYDPKSRVRLDVSATLVMTEVKRKKQSKRNHGGLENADSTEDEELTVIIQCVTFLKALAPEIDVSTDALNAIADGSASWIKVMLQSIRDFIDAL